MYTHHLFIYYFILISTLPVGLLASRRAASPTRSQSQSSQSTSAADAASSQERSSDGSPMPSPRTPHEELSKAGANEAQEKVLTNDFRDRVTKFLMRYYASEGSLTKIREAIIKEEICKDAKEFRYIQSFIHDKIRQFKEANQNSRMTATERRDKAKWFLCERWLDSPSQKPRTVHNQPQGK